MKLLPDVKDLPGFHRWFVDLRQRADARAGENRRWVSQLLDLCRRLSSSEVNDYPSGWMAVSLFYVRLYAVVEELPNRLQPGADYWEAIAESDLERLPDRDRAILETVRTLTREIRRATLAVRDALSFEERVVLWLVRNYNCHIAIDGDGLKLQKDGGVSELRDVAGRKLTVAAIDEIRSEMARRYPDESHGAKAMAVKLVPHVEHLLTALENLLLVDFR